MRGMMAHPATKIPAMSSTGQLLAQHLADPTSSWSVGELGVLAEFHHHGPTSQPDAFTVVTGGGAIRIDPRGNLVPLAYETPSANPRLWNHGVVFCLPAEEACMSVRTCVTELGLDAESILPGARGDMLFDLGLGLRTADFMVRTGDAVLLSVLRAACGRRWSDDHALNAAIIAASPARVIVSRLARVEITNPIPQPGGVSPDGPHTHLLPAIMRRGRVHDANIPVPPGLLPCLTLYPAHPARDAEGRERAFDPGQHLAYQRLLQGFGHPDYLAAKAGDANADSRVAHLGRLIARRQQAFVQAA